MLTFNKPYAKVFFESYCESKMQEFALLLLRYSGTAMGQVVTHFKSERQIECLPLREDI